MYIDGTAEVKFNRTRRLAFGHEDKDDVWEEVVLGKTSP